TEIVDLEPGRPSSHRGLEVQMLAAELGKTQLTRIATHGGPGRIEGQVAIGSLEVVHRAVLRRGDDGGRTRYPRQVELPRKLVALPGEPMVKVHGPDVGLFPQELVAPGIQVPIYGRRDDAHVALAAAEVLQSAQHRVVGGRLERGVSGDSAAHALRDGVEET